jgi:hypothetical protein
VEVAAEIKFFVEAGETMLAMRDVDAFVCQECAKAYYTPQTSGRIDKVMQKFYR